MSDGAAASSPRKKKLPFKPTALRRAAPKSSPKDEDKEDEDDVLALFRRSKEMAPIVAADRERRMRRKQRHAEEERKRAAVAGKRPLQVSDVEEAVVASSEGREGRHPEEDEPMVIDDGPAVDRSMTVTGDSFKFASLAPSSRTSTKKHHSELVTPPPSKRSRIDSSSSRKYSASIEPRESALDASPSTRRLRSQPSLSTPRREVKPTSVPPSGAPIISLDSDSDEDIKPCITPTPTKHRDSSIEILDPASPGPADTQPKAEEDEFAEYIRKAEAQRERDQALLRSQSEDAKKESTEILISSEVPGVQSVIMKITFDKPLRIVRETWTAVQAKKGIQIPVDQCDDVVLTWRRKKVYNFTTLLSLGIRPRGGGRLIADSQSREGLNSSKTKVHMEAWTPELFQEMEAQAELQRQREAGEISEEEKEELPEVKLRVILKARDLEGVRLMVRPETTVETLVTGFRTQKGLGSDRDVTLWFDGDQLEEHVTMDEAEIDDMDTIEVHIK
ncbi:Fc.00g066290.m01.CDS01 [Cosmosporella sp. VM-42]